MNTQLTKIKLAAQHYLRSLGQSGTTNEGNKLMNRNTVPTIMKLAKNAGFVAMLLLTLASCGKETELVPKEQVVTYTLTCQDCLIYLEDSKWNRNNKLDRSKNQYFNVKGDFSYKFTNTVGLDSVEATIYVGVFGPRQKVTLRIQESLHGKSLLYDHELGLGNAFGDDDRTEVTVALGLNGDGAL